MGRTSIFPFVVTFHLFHLSITSNFMNEIKVHSSDI